MLQCLIGELNEKQFTEVLEAQSKDIELYSFVASFIAKTPEAEAMFNKAADFRNKCLAAAKLLREIECDVDRLVQRTIAGTKT